MPSRGASTVSLKSRTASATFRAAFTGSLSPPAASRAPVTFSSAAVTLFRSPPMARGSLGFFFRNSASSFEASSGFPSSWRIWILAYARSALLWGSV
jgi:hypothetical protein